MKKLKRQFFIFAILLASTLDTTAYAAPANGIWVTGTGGYFLLMQDAANSNAIALEVASDMSSISVYTGSVAGDDLSLQKLDQSVALTAKATGSSMSGTYTQTSGVTSAFSATLNYTYAGSAYDGVWQKSSGNSYLAFLTANVQGATTSVVIELTINTDGTYTHDVIIGSTNNSVYTGVSFINSSVLRLTFDGSAASGSNTNTSMQTTTFTANQIFSVNK